MVTKFKILLTSLFLVLLMQACDSDKKMDGIKNEVVFDGSFLSKTHTTKAVLSNQKEELTLTGKVETDPDKEIRFVPLISGVIDRVYFSLGDKVQKGQTLIDIRSTDLSALQSELISLEGELTVIERELKTAQDMYNDNMISEKELLEVQTKLKQTQAAHNKIKVDMSVFGTNRGNGIFSIKAPMTGYITTKNASAGSTVSADSEPLFTIADLNTVWITANVYASNLLFVREGLDANITTLSYPGEVFKGKISNMSQVFDPEDKALKARIVLPNKDLKLKPEMSVVIKLNNEIHNQLISIPSDAVIFDNDRYFVVTKDDTSENFGIKEISIQGHNNKITYISGLAEGDNVVTRNQLLIYNQLIAN